MPLRRQHWITYALAAIVAIAAMRMVMVHGTLLMRWQVQWETFALLVLGTLSIESPPLGERHPREQAQYWIRQTESLNSESDPELIPGGAWVLSNPDTRFWRNFVRRNPDLPSGSGIPIQMMFQLDSDAIAEATDQFHELTRDRCIELSDMRVRLEPENVEAWRMRALLAFERNAIEGELVPRRADWQTVLIDCEQHDPTNALYAVLAANQCWNESAEREWRGNADHRNILVVHDESRFNEGVRYLNAAMQKPSLSFGNSQNAALFHFLDSVNSPVMGRVELAGSLSAVNYVHLLLFDVYRWKKAELNQKVASGNVIAAEKTLLDIDAMLDLLSRSDNSLDLRTTSLQLKRSTHANYRKFVDQHTPFVTATDRETVQRKLDSASRDSGVLNRAFARVNGQLEGNEAESEKTQSLDGDFAAVLLMIAIATTAVLLLLSPIIASLLAAAGWLFGKGQPDSKPTSWWVQHVASWLIGSGLTSVVFGLFPARIISATTQSRVLLTICGLTITVGLAVLQSDLAKRTEIKRRTLTTHLFATTLLLSTIAMWPDAVNLSMRLFQKLHPAASLGFGALFTWLTYAAASIAFLFIRSPQITRLDKILSTTVILATATLLATGLTILRTNGLPKLDLFQPIAGQQADRMGLSDDGIKELMNVDSPSLVWAFLQWLAHGGPIATAIIAFVISIAWTLFRSKPPHDLPSTGPLTWRSRIAATCSIHAHYALHISLAVLAATLFLLPATVEKPLTRHEHWKAQLEDRYQANRRVDQQVLQIRSDPAVMADIETEINKWNESYANQLSAELNWADEIADEEGYGDGPTQNAAE